MSAAPVVSVVMKAYDHERYVGEAIESVLAQTFGDFELLVTDDASNDGTAAVVERYDDPRIRFERQPVNRGISATMNAMVARARGEFVAILNSDDVAYPDRLQRQLDVLRRRPDAGAAFCVPRQIGEDGEPVDGFGALFAIPFAHPEPSRAEWLRHLFMVGNCLSAPTAMIRTAVYRALGPDDQRYALLMDFDRWVRLLEHHEIVVDAQPHTAFRVRAGAANASAASEANFLRDAFESFAICRRYRAFAPDLLRAVFAWDIACLGLDPARPVFALLAEAALIGPRRWHRLFALETLHEALADAGTRDDLDEPELRRLHELTAVIDAFDYAAVR